MDKCQDPVDKLPIGYRFKRLAKFAPGPDAPREYLDHTWENGRRYRGHKTEFPFTNDEKATEAYGTLNTTWSFLLEPTHIIRAPVVLIKGNKVLDCAARGMTWMSHVEEAYPGVRISAIDPNCAWMYPTNINVHHHIDGDWPYTARQAFHYTRAHALGGMVASYEGFYRNAFRHLLPGGWFEVRDNELRFLTDSPSPEKEEKLVSLRRWESLMAEAAERFGKPINMASKHKALMEEAGFTQVTEQVFKIPYGEWMEERKPWHLVGGSYAFHMELGLEGYTLRLFTQTLGWSVDDTKKFITQVQAELAEAERENFQLYSNFHLVFGQKPQNSSRKL
ncbi:hypothetical protein BDV12DRAFT_104601 [Aspergillus spectabilis]